MPPTRGTRQYTQKQLAKIWDWYRNHPEAQKARDKRRRQAWHKAQISENTNIYKKHNTLNNNLDENWVKELQQEIYEVEGYKNFTNDKDGEEVDQLVLSAYNKYVAEYPEEEAVGEEARAVPYPTEK